jgi:hypothetical protein
MLSPHELATLMVVKDAPDQIELDRMELHTLLEWELVRVEVLHSGHLQARIMPTGHGVLQAISRTH